MTSPEAYRDAETLFELSDHDDATIRILGHIGLVDASIYDHPNPPEAERRWAKNPIEENPCVFPSED